MIFYGAWGPNGKGHAPWIGATINYTHGNTEYAPAAQKTGTVDLTQGIVNSGVFVEKEIDDQHNQFGCAAGHHGGACGTEIICKYGV